VPPRWTVDAIHNQRGNQRPSGGDQNNDLDSTLLEQCSNEGALGLGASPTIIDRLVHTKLTYAIPLSAPLTRGMEMCKVTSSSPQIEDVVATTRPNVTRDSHMQFFFEQSTENSTECGMWDSTVVDPLIWKQ
jgi:hypothetical protein